MSVKLYMDVHVPRAVTNQLRLHGIDVLTAQEEGAAELDDTPLLDHATRLGGLREYGVLPSSLSDRSRLARAGKGRSKN
jgi:hypothetical protein